MDDLILVTFVVDIKFISYNHKKIYRNLSRNIIQEIKYKEIRAYYIYVTVFPVDPYPEEEYQRLYITYEIQKYDANLFIHKVKSSVMMIFHDFLNNKNIKFLKVTLVNENINYDYYKGYWDDFSYVSNSPRLYSPRGPNNKKRRKLF
jgi:predicted HTH transcriptional regulator